MAKRRKTQTLGETLKELRQERGLSIQYVRDQVILRLPVALWVSDETLRRYEADYHPIEKADPVLLSALADVYGVELEVIDPTLTATEGARQIGWLLGFRTGRLLRALTCIDQPVALPKAELALLA